MDPEFLNFLSQWENADDLSLQPPVPTLCLAVRIFQHAVHEGYIEIIDTSISGMEEIPLWAGINLYVNQVFAGPTDTESLRDSIAFALRNRCQIAVGDEKDLRDINHALSVGRTGKGKDKQRNLPGLLPYSQIKKGRLRETVFNWHPKSIGEIFGCIDHPTLLPSLTEAVAEAIENEAYKKDLWLFLPRLVLDAMTAGAASYAEMLYRIFKKNWRR
ncbi:MAG TPA: hypothetical protein VGH16_08785 [Candidatus Binatia bacterium]